MTDEIDRDEYLEYSVHRKNAEIHLRGIEAAVAKLNTTADNIFLEGLNAGFKHGYEKGDLEGYNRGYEDGRAHCGGRTTTTQTPPPPVPDKGSEGIWILPSEIMALPNGGSAWQRVEDRAGGPWPDADIGNQNSTHNIHVLACAYYSVRTKSDIARTRVFNEIAAMVNNAKPTALALARNLLAYIVAADVVGLREPWFINWLDWVRTETYTGRTLISNHEDRPNNWGTHAGASRIAAALYLDDGEDLEKAAAVFRGWCGDRDAYADFRYHDDLSWQSGAPVGINPVGARINGHNVDGCLPEEMRRAGSFHWPPEKENYCWEALQGAVCQAQLLFRGGYADVWEWSDKAIFRAVRWLYEEASFPPEGDDTWIPYVVNKAYRTIHSMGFPTPGKMRDGKNMGFTDWTHTL